MMSRCNYHSCYWLTIVSVLSVAMAGMGIAGESAGDEPLGVAEVPPAFGDADIDFFESKIRPLLVARCQRCHGPEKQEAGLRLDSRASVITGGDSGPAVVPNELDASLLIDAVHYGELFQMPPKQKLADSEIALLDEWVRRGAPWSPEDSVSQESATSEFDLERRKREHWAWAPIVAPPNDLAASAIDKLLLEELEAAGLQRAKPADKRTLIRRATFDLIGLPPTREEVEAFQADSSAGAFAKVVDRLLSSPHFGERWARHWLDLVRYAETFGHEHDYPQTDAWRYRDYVIRAFNADVPYDQIVREHIAGDLLDQPRLHPSEGYNESVIATAFWFLGEAQHAPVDSLADYATRVDNQIDVVSKTFLGLTVACARCHDHKFDAISTKDYYALAGYFTSSHQDVALLDPQGQIEAGRQQLVQLQGQGRDTWTRLFTERGREIADHFRRCLLASRAVLENSDATAVDRVADEFEVDRALLKRFIAAATEPAAQEPGHPLFAWNRLIAANEPDDSFVTRRTVLDSEVQQVSRQAAALAQDQQLFEDFATGFDNWFVRGSAFGDSPTKCGDWQPSPNGPELIAGGMAHSGRYGARLQGVMRSAKFTITKPFVLYRVGGSKGQIRLVVDGYAMDRFMPLLFEGLSFTIDPSRGMYWHPQSVAKYIGHRAHIEIIDTGDGFIALDEIRFASSTETVLPEENVAPLILAKREVVSADSLAEAYSELLSQGITDWLEGEPSASAEFVRWLVSKRLLPLSDAAHKQLAELSKELSASDLQIPYPLPVVAIADGSAEDQHVYIRGNHKNLGDLVPRRLLEAIAGEDQPPPSQGSGRLELAERILADDNPFTARVMANRIWQHLFGRGIVASVDNFGVMGQKPTHPELLDYLATQFRHEGWSIKKLIREIMLSDAYQMTSVSDEATEQKDPLNLLLHRANVRRLEGEVIRDELLAVSGRLDRKQYGPSVPIYLSAFMDGRGRPKESGPLDGDGRRSVYLEVRRNFLSPFFGAFDTPPPMSTVGQRNLSNVPAQALALLNDPFVIEQSRVWAERTLAEKGTSPAERITNMYLTAFSRPPSNVEITEAIRFLDEQANLYQVGSEDVQPWADLCHVLVNVKEFIFIR